MKFPGVLSLMFLLALVGLVEPETSSHDIALWIKISYSLVVAIVIPVYWVHWGPSNFLWFSDIALILCVPALWLESSLLASMMAVGVLLPELYWNIEFLLRLLTGKKFTGLTSYMFEREHPLFLRLLSLFHILIPPVLILMLSRFGYEPQALLWQTVLAWIVLWVCYKFTSPQRNINWAFGPGNTRQSRFSPRLYLILIMLAYLIFNFLPAHFLLNFLFNS